MKLLRRLTIATIALALAVTALVGAPSVRSWAEPICATVSPATTASSSLIEIRNARAYRSRKRNRTSTGDTAVERASFIY